jgi:hypothetical protein
MHTFLVVIVLCPALSVAIGFLDLMETINWTSRLVWDKISELALGAAGEWGKSR